ncbi:hypothetical protein WG31_09170 [Acetobacter oryzifermentans]|uniref:Uncharacterized protein n=2 Tax=Acetobacter oryzifermentans TaxID=1633874 RepID=A0ABM6AKF9_9PROT|nr:hypothetical protein WG31_09170 [Acetobacter oryzifermentans]
MKTAKAHTMTPININAIDANLLADIAGQEKEFSAYQVPVEGRDVANQAYQIVFSDAIQRGGIVMVGSGSSGMTFWTDANSADDVLRRYLADEMMG